jgi:hypothetical protein
MSIHIEPFPVPGIQETFRHQVSEAETSAFSALIGVSTDEDQCKGRYSSTSNHFMIAIITGALNSHFGAQGLECLNMHFEFLSAIHCGDAIETIIECTHTDPAKNLATFKINCFKQDKEQVITGQAVIITPH